MARVLMERNQYKERLMELQEAVRWTEMIRFVNGILSTLLTIEEEIMVNCLSYLILQACLKLSNYSLQ